MNAMIGRPPNARLVEVLIQLHKAGRSGIVRLTRGPIKRQLALRGGRVALAESTAPDEHLARILVGRNLLDPKELKSIGALMKAGKTSDEAIAEAAALSPEQILEGAREQVVVILSSLLTWRSCETRLYAGEGLLPRRLNLEMPVPQILVLAARRAACQAFNDRSAAEMSGNIVAAPDQGLINLLPLDGAELFAYSRVLDSVAVKDVLPILPTAGTKPAELLYRLWLLGLLRSDVPGEADQPAAAAVSAHEQLEAQLEDMLARFEVADYYEILSVPADASEEQIHAAYHERARQYHPDRFEARHYGEALRTKAERLFTYITGAYSTLSSPAARQGYDETRAAKGRGVEAVLQNRAGGDAEMEKMAEALFRAGCVSLSGGEHEKAVRHLKECVWLRPETAKYRHYLGVAQAGIPRFRKEAEQHLLKALELDSLRLESRLELGKLYLKVDLPKRAEAQFLEVLRWDPGNPTATKLLAEAGGGSSSRGSRPGRSGTLFVR